MTPKGPDEVLQPFLTPSFDPAEYLNSTLPPLGSAATTAKGDKAAVSLSQLNSETQSLLSNLKAQTSRQIDLLTQQTDEILRSGSRLAYEVEVLKGDTATLTEALREDLADDIETFVPESILKEVQSSEDQDGEATEGVIKQNGVKSDLNTPRPDLKPQAMAQLRTLSLVRSRLDLVVKVFGDALNWTLPPSEISVASSFISVSAPEPGSDSYSREEKGQEVQKKLRDEVTSILSDSSQPPAANIRRASKRVAEIGMLAQVWKGTAEEKSRLKLVDTLIKMVEEKQKQLDKEQAQAQRKGERTVVVSPRKSIGAARSQTPDESARDSGYGFISQLQRMRGGL